MTLFLAVLFFVVGAAVGVFIIALANAQRYVNDQRRLVRALQVLHSLEDAYPTLVAEARAEVRDIDARFSEE